jgi:branched-chain amino acid transport system permease protein
MDWWQTFWATYSTLVFSIGVNVLLAASIYLTLWCGLLSLANAAFMGLGAYTAALLTTQLSEPFGLALLAGAALPALVALVIGVPTLRLAGIYLAMATLAFGEVVRVIAINLGITGGPLGLNGIPQDTRWWHVVLALVVTFYVLARLRGSKMGRAFDAIRQDEVAARLMGINVTACKLTAFVLGAAIAGVAGGLNAHFTFFISPNEFGFERAVDILTMAVFGGTGGLLGPAIGGTVLTLLPEVLRVMKEYRLAVNGLILILVVLFLPNGIWDPLRFRRRRQRLAATAGIDSAEGA